MLKPMRKLLKNPQKRTGIIICTIVIFIAAVFVLLELEIQYNKALYVRNYMSQQKLLTKQLTLRMKENITSGYSDVNDMIDEISGSIETSGSRYLFVTKNNQMLFAKNSAATKLYHKYTLGKFMRKCKALGMKITYSSFTADGDRYTAGICTKENYIEDKGQLFRLHVYIIMPFILGGLIFLAVSIFELLRINQQEYKINQLNSEALERNITIEQLSVRIKKNRLDDLGKSADIVEKDDDAVIYSKEVLLSLLDKINRENFTTLSIAVVELSSVNRNMPPEDYQKVFKTVTKILNTGYVLAEIMPSYFSILLFNMTAQEMDGIKKTLVTEWALPLKKQGIKVKIGISEIKDYDTDVENVFDMVYKGVLGDVNLDSRMTG